MSFMFSVPIPVFYPGSGPLQRSSHDYYPKKMIKGDSACH